jgi:hypothetical protein
MPDDMNNNPAPMPDLNAIGKLLGNVDMSALSGLLNNIDINQVMSMMAPLMNSNTAPNFAPNVAPNGGPLPAAPLFPAINDPRVAVLNSIKPFLPPHRITIIDQIIKFLGVVVTINSLMPPKK